MRRMDLLIQSCWLPGYISQCISNFVQYQRLKIQKQFEAKFSIWLKSIELSVTIYLPARLSISETSENMQKHRTKEISGAILAYSKYVTNANNFFMHKYKKVMWAQIFHSALKYMEYIVMCKFPLLFSL